MKFEFETKKKEKIKDCINPNCKSGIKVFDTFCPTCINKLNIYERIRIGIDQGVIKL